MMRRRNATAVLAFALGFAWACSAGESPPIDTGGTTTGSETGGETTSTGTPPLDMGVATSSTSVESSGAVATSSGTAMLDSSTGDVDPGLPSIGPTDGVFTFDPQVGLVGAGSLHVGDVMIENGFGTVVVDDVPLPVLVYEEQPFGEWTLYQSLAVAPDGWTVIWFYCSEGLLTDVYFETTNGLPLQYELASGTCDIVPGAVEVDVQFPGTEFALIYNGEDFSITGPEIAVTGGELGTLTIEGTDFVLAPFETVDCADCGGAGWFEVHAVLWEPIAASACFAIFYLTPDRSEVQMTYAMCLPDLVDPMGSIFFPATWEIP